MRQTITVAVKHLLLLEVERERMQASFYQLVFAASPPGSWKFQMNFPVFTCNLTLSKLS